MGVSDAIQGLVTGLFVLVGVFVLVGGGFLWFRSRGAMRGR